MEALKIFGFIVGLIFIIFCVVASCEEIATCGDRKCPSGLKPRYVENAGCICVTVAE